MDVVIVALISVACIAAESFILNRAQKRAECEHAVLVRLARYAGRQVK